MGNSESKKSAALSKTAWRTFAKSGTDLEESLRKDIKCLNPEKQPNALLLGHISAGKSSLINSCLSVSKERIVALAPTGESTQSYTLKLNVYTDNNLLKHLILKDCMGIEPEDENGFDPEDIFFLMKGHIKNGYKFQPKIPMTKASSFYRTTPKFEHETHCIVFVIDASTIHENIEEEDVIKIKRLQESIKTEGIPRVLILTKVDRLCGRIHASNIFRSVAVEKTMKTASKLFSIDMGSIHPVINYHEDVDPSSAKNILILLALRSIMQYACDRVELVLAKSKIEGEEEGGR